MGNVDFTILNLIIRTLAAYGIIFVIFRLMGKREIGEVGVFDLVIFVMLAEMAVISIDDLEKNFWHGILPMIILLVVQRLIAFISLKSQRVREVIDGTASILIEKGKINEKEMKKNRYNLDDLLEQLHENGIQLIQDVDYAILEPTGKLSIFKKEDHPQKIYDPLIKDGIIQHKVLKQMGKDEMWLKNELKKAGYLKIEDIFYCSVNKDGTLYVDENDIKDKT